MAIIFDGKVFAAKIESELKQRLAKMARIPKLVTICNPLDTSGRIYTKIKAAKAMELGADFEQFDFNSNPNAEDLISRLNDDKTVDGIMVQLPLTGDDDRDEKLCKMIAPGKDADGLNPESGVMQATVRGVMEILNKAMITSPLPFPSPKLRRGARGEVAVAVIGSDGTVGRGIVAELRRNEQFTIYNLDKNSFDKEKIKAADIIISATGQEGLINPEMVKEGVIVIDVGFPKGDFDPGVALKAAFFTPVPGGVGPVTVAMLFANLADLADRQNTS
jgi:methylenetetrahydrofolate dehydrogenase (NADP+)/methenyltetrahydrofolate cyclohydrolase